MARRSHMRIVYGKTEKLSGERRRFSAFTIRTREANESARDQSGNRDAAPSSDGGHLVTGQSHVSGDIAATDAARAQPSAAGARITAQDSTVRSNRATNGADSGGRAARACRA